MILGNILLSEEQKEFLFRDTNKMEYVVDSKAEEYVLGNGELRTFEAGLAPLSHRLKNC